MNSAGGDDDQESDGGKNNGVEGILGPLCLARRFGGHARRFGGLAGHESGDEVEENQQAGGLKIEGREGGVSGPDEG